MMGRLFLRNWETHHLAEEELFSSASSGSPSTAASQKSRSTSPTRDDPHCGTPLLKHPFMAATRRLLLPKSLPEEEPLSNALGALGLSCQVSDAPSHASSFPQVTKCPHSSCSRPHSPVPDFSAHSAYPLSSSQPAATFKHTSGAASRVRSSSFSGRSSDAVAPSRRPSRVDKGPWLPSGSHRTARLVPTTSTDTSHTTECFFSCEPDTSRDVSQADGPGNSSARKRVKRTSSGEVKPCLTIWSNETENRALSARSSVRENSRERAPHTPPKKGPGESGEVTSRQIVEKKRKIGGFIGLLLSLFERDGHEVDDCAHVPQRRGGNSSSTNECQPCLSVFPTPPSPTCPGSSTLSSASPLVRSDVERKGVSRSYSVGSTSVRRPAGTSEPVPFPTIPGFSQSASIPPAGERPRWSDSQLSFVDKNRRTPLCLVPASSGSPLLCTSPCIPGYSRLAQFADASHRLLRLAWSGCCVSVLVWLLLHLAISLYRDIKQGEEQRQLQNAAEAAHCRQQHRDNGCDTLDPLPPYLQQPCTEWKACLMRQPDSHGERTKVVAAVVGDVLNVFFQRLEW